MHRNLDGKGLRSLVVAGLVLVAVACAPEPVPSVAPSVSSSARVPGDGSIPDNESISLNDNEHAAIANLDPALLAAVREAAVDAQAQKVELKVTSGWRSAQYQQRLMDDAVARYRSEKEARRWVQTPEKSKHVTGTAIDIGPTNAADWLIRHGADYGLCQAYAHEMWHFELLTTRGGQCPQPISVPPA
ncbi:D-alanyl-D-alanine carboxypeptidase-like protein [Lentzea atacamensis]|uniref:D-alanyl-D-alanine carboxypeptidase-like protein n=1 Tax=Lentzea atacamensis TaxID=531938 RepID=A0A316IHA8_9PSEU|nr:M15 family metallopeptidase [Lentzea atacamensis]PWK89608.1 D-alanyl-D-alanine carboxypeptidase-like protein [Lentzea atacamensis]